MKKLFFTFLFVCILQTIHSQELPEIIPPSPTAYEITKYGDVPINESSGRVSKNIPIYNYKAGNLEIPINISYTGNGVKVDQLSTWTGINWSLNAGGVITRVVNDRPDESNNTTRTLYDWQDLSALDLQNNQTNIDQMQSIANGNQYDTEVDIFNFSFPGYSGSFYLGEEDLNGNFECIQTKYDSELKINFLITAPDDQQEFDITTPDGVKYYFGSSNASEQTRTDNYGSTIQPTTAYYLYAIIHPFGDTIFLTYTSPPENHFLRLSQYQSQSILYASQTQECSPSGGEYSSGHVTNQVYNGRYLSEISSNRSNKKVLINSTHVPNNIHYNRVLNSIEVVDNLYPNTDEEFIFSYLYPNTTSNSTRFFLEKIEFKNYLNNTKYDYDFVYNDPLGLPDRMSFSQDYLGYYNGATNTSLLPKGQSETYFPDQYYNDREPNFSTASKGVLTQINYPTGGYTQIEYESPQKMTYKRLFLKVFSSQSSLIPDTDLTDLVSLAEVDENGLITGVYEDQTISVNVNVNASGNINHHYIITVKVTNLSSTPNEVQEQSMFLETGVYDYNRSFDFDLIKDNIYNVEMVLDPDSTSQTPPSPVYATAYLDYLNGAEFIDWLGIRVKRTLDYTDSSTTPITKRYYYKKVKDYTNPIEQPFIVFNPNFISYSKKVMCCLVGNFTMPFQFYYINLNSSSFNHYFPSSNTQNLYKNVSVSYGGDHFENGGVEKQFSISGDRLIDSFSIPTSFGGNNEDFLITQFVESKKTNQGLYDGYLKKQSTYKKQHGELYLTNVDDLNYITPIQNTIPNILIKKIHDICYSNVTIANLYIASFSTFSYKKNLLSKQTTSYIDPVPIDDLDNANNYKQVTTSQNYEYDSFAGLPTKITTSTSNTNKILETKNYYVDQIGQLSGLTGTQIADYTSLVNANRLTNIIQTKNYQIDGTSSPELLSTQRTLFKNWNSGSLILPEYVQTSKLNNSLENRIRFYDYSIYGDLLEVSKGGGAKIRYVYTNTSQVSRKIENYDSSTNEPAFSSNSVATPCYYQNEHPNSLVTLFNYKNGTNLIESITDPRCRTIYYHYDEFNRLKFVKDHDGNVLSENEYNYKPQN